VRPAHPWQLEPTVRFLAFLPLTLAVAGLALELVAHGVGSTGPRRPAWLMATGTGLVHAGVLILVARLLRDHAMTWRQAFGLFTAPRPNSALRAMAWTVPAMVVAWALHEAAGFTLEQLGREHQAQAAVEALQHSNRAWEQALLGFFAVVTAPVAEEILFRGILWTLLKQRGWGRGAAFASAALFAAIHLNLAAFLPLLALGLFWTWLYHRSDDLLLPILSHAVFNAANFAWLTLAPPPVPS